jgi:hypothetical protein
MTRVELIRMFVLDSMCDDFEDIERITDWTIEWGSKCGLMVSHDDIIQALHELIELGYTKAYDLERWADPPTTESQREEITPLNPRFARTEEGLAFQKANSTNRPLDEDHNFRESWLTPEAASRRRELVRWLVLDSYPGNCTHVFLGHIETRWKGLAERYGISISRDEFIEALRELVGLGYLKASYKDADFWQYDGMPPIEDIKPFGAYFWVTGAGFDFHTASAPLWPFEESDDGESRVRKDWVPPDA